MNQSEPNGKNRRPFLILLAALLIVAVTMISLLLTGVIPLGKKRSENTTTGDSSAPSTELSGTTEQSTENEGKGSDRVDQNLIDNMAPATEVSGITITQEMLDAGILNEGNKARLMSVMERAAKGEDITLAYIGGSITAGSSASPMSTGCFAALTTKWWEDTFPAAHFTYVNAGIGATDSWVGAHRAADDVISANPDLVVAEFAVNDGQGWNQETYDSLLRTLLEAPSAPAVVSLMIAHKNGSFTDKHAPVAFQYQVPIITYSALLSKKMISWEKVGNADGTHPDNPGHQLIAHLLTSYYRKVLSEINQTAPEEYTVPSLSESLTKCRYTNGDILFSDELTPDSAEGFAPAAVTKILSSDKGWKTSSGGSISFTVEAREIGVIWLQKSVDPEGTYMNYRLIIDGEEKGTLAGVASSWGPHLEYKTEMLGETAEKHTIELRPADDTTGSEFEILGIGVCR